MKKINYFSILLCAVLTLSWGLTSCEESQNKNEEVINPAEDVDDPKGEAVDTLMSADESKKYLMNAGKELLNTFNTADQKSAVELIEGVVWKMDNYDWDYDAFADYATKDIEDMFSITKYLANVASGKQSPMQTKIYTFNFSRQAVIFEANENTHKWENKGKSEDNSVILRMKSNRNSSLEAKCWGEGNTHSYSYTYYVGEVPQERYTYVGKFKYVGHDSYWDEETWETVYTYYGDYEQYYDESTGMSRYKYVGQGKGDFIIGDNVSYEYVGENHGSYERNDNHNWTGNEDDWYDFVGANKGHYTRLTTADAMYSLTSYNWPYTYVYDECGDYAKYTYYREEIDEKPFEGSEARTITVDLPEKIYFTLKEGNDVIISCVQTFDLQENDHYNLSGEYTFTNLKWAQAIHVTYESADASMSFKYGDKTIIAANVKLPSYEMIKKQSSETYGEYGERVYDRWESLLNEVGEITTKINLIDRVQVIARVSHMGDLYNAYLDWDDTFGQQRNMSYQAAKALRNIYNNYCLAGIYYNSNTAQAMVDFDIYATEGESGSYEIEPVLYFPSDETSYSYGQYFSERRFGNLIDLTEDVANSYIDLLKLFDADHIDLH